MLLYKGIYPIVNCKMVSSWIHTVAIQFVLSFRIPPIPKGQDNWLPEVPIFASINNVFLYKGVHPFVNCKNGTHLQIHSCHPICFANCNGASVFAKSTLISLLQMESLASIWSYFSINLTDSPDSGMGQSGRLSNFQNNIWFSLKVTLFLK